MEPCVWRHGSFRRPASASTSRPRGRCWLRACPRRWSPRRCSCWMRCRCPPTARWIGAACPNPSGPTPAPTSRPAPGPKRWWPPSSPTCCSWRASGRRTTSSRWVDTRSWPRRSSRACGRGCGSSSRCGRCSKRPPCARWLLGCRPRRGPWCRRSNTAPPRRSARGCRMPSNVCGSSIGSSRPARRTTCRRRSCWPACSTRRRCNGP